MYTERSEFHCAISGALELGSSRVMEVEDACSSSDES